MRHVVAGLAVGILFGAGLGVAGMTDPAIVLGFLDVAGDWNPTLAFVMGGALAVTFVGYRLVWRWPAPLLEQRFHLPSKTDLDAPLLGGAMLFGIGWGLSGWCPGPAIASLSAFTVPLGLFLVAMLAGLGAVRILRSSGTSAGVAIKR